MFKLAHHSKQRAVSPARDLPEVGPEIQRQRQRLLDLFLLVLLFNLLFSVDASKGQYFGIQTQENQIRTHWRSSQFPSL
jgi:hypothetical protein